MAEQATDNLPPIAKNVYLIINRQIVPLENTITRLGRQLDNDIVFHEESVSRNHAEIRYEEGQYVIYDKHSTAGTYVNSKRIERCVLNSGDLISLATVQMMFVNNNARLADISRGTTRSLRRDK